MTLMNELRKQMQSRSTDELIELLCKPDAELTLAHFVDLSSFPEAPLLETEFAGRPIMHAKLVRRMIAPMILEKTGPAGFLDDSRIVSGIDNEGMLPRITYLYQQMVQMNKVMSDFVAERGALPPAKRIVAFGLGGSASGPLLAREIIENQGYSVPFDIHMSYPERFHGIDADTMVVACSYSGNTEETLAAFDYAQRRTKNLLILARGGKLGELKDEFPFVEIPESDIQAPRESIGYWMAALWFIVSSLGIAKKEDGGIFRFDVSDVQEIQAKLDEIDAACAGETRFAQNPAKQYAAYFLYGNGAGEASSATDYTRPRQPVFILDGADRAIGKRLANQFGETVEHPVWLLMFAEDAHNEIESAATFLLEDKLYRDTRERSYIRLSSRPYQRRNARDSESRAVQRIEATLDTLFRQHDVDFLRIETDGSTLLERKLSLLKILDYARYYASILLGTNPLPTVFMEMMKKVAGRIPGSADRELLRLLTGSRELPMSKKDAIRNKQLMEKLPALRRTILDRLIEYGYLTVDEGKLSLSDKGREFMA